MLGQSFIRLEYEKHSSIRVVGWLGKWRKCYWGQTRCHVLHAEERQIFQHKKLIVVFFDGIDECIYETPTISFVEILLQVQRSKEPKEFVSTMLEKVYSHGAEDNASIGYFEFL